MYHEQEQVLAQVRSKLLISGQGDHSVGDEMDEKIDAHKMDLKEALTYVF